MTMQMKNQSRAFYSLTVRRSFGRMRRAAVLVLLAAAAVSVRADRVVDVRSTVHVSGESVRLGVLVHEEADLTDSERRTFVMPAPEPGSVTRLSLIDLAYRLQNVPGLLDVQLRGPQRIAVHGGGDAAFLQRCRREIARTIARTPPWSEWTVKVSLGLDDERRLAAMPAGFSSLRVSGRDPALLLGSVAVDVAFLDSAGERLAECRLQPTILREVSVLMMAEARDRGHVITAEDVRETTVWAGSDPRQYVQSRSLAVGSQINRRLNAAELLRPGHLSPPLCTERGDLVHVRCEGNGLLVSLSALALERGRRGDTIRLRNTTSDVVFRAVLSGRKEAVFSR